MFSLFESTDFTDPTECYWNNSINNSYENNIINKHREIKKEKIIKRKQKSIDNFKNNFEIWLDKVSKNDNMSILVIDKLRIKYIKQLNKKIQDLEKIKKLPISDKMFN